MKSVKTTNQAFVRIATDQAIEHVNKMCKIDGGIVNITRNESARQYWERNHNERGHLTQLLYDMFSIPSTTLLPQVLRPNLDVCVIFRM